MGPRREILDSEDDGSDFGDEGEFGDAAAPELAEQVFPHDMENAVVDASRSTGATDSTDPSFFQHVYDQQQAAAAAADTQDIIPDTAPPAGPDPGPGPAASTWTEVSSAPPPGQNHQSGNFSSLTSITDPVPASRKSKRAQEIPQSEVIDLTDVPTPPKPGGAPPVDRWDVPPSSSSQRATRTYGKPKIAPLSLEQEPVSNTMPPTQDPYAFPESTPPVRKKPNRRETPARPPRKAQDSSPVMLVPTEEAPSSSRPTRSSRKKKDSSFATVSTMPDTAAPSLYVAQSTLTTSQKQEYQVVSLSSEAGLEVLEMLPPEQPSGAGETYRSSAATTIAYPTPSRVAVSSRLPGVEEDGYGTGFVETSLDQEANYQSSPDVLADMTNTSASRSKRSRIKIVSSAGLASSEADPPASTRRAKKRKIVREAEDDSWEMGSLGAPQEDVNHTNDPENTLPPTMQPEADMGGPSPIPEPKPSTREVAEPPTSTAKGKRGRKKKAPKSQALIPEPREPTPPAEAIPEPEIIPIESPEPPPAIAKRKRGRPGKSKVAPPPFEVEEPQQPAEEAEGDGANNTVSHPLSPIHPNSRPDQADNTAGGDGNSEGNAAPEAVVDDMKVKDKAKEREMEKQTGKDAKTAGSGVQKVQYRVGLSKRSRIAPLLKSLKKPV